ncbi:RNA helicase [Halteromyces radiatus]|uniref:RNA helicase n=1 Tax=Halteromyces radiatus TaxID=101107 RepID=UPI00221ECA7A|nr:RNA helicase [Halteromyces radiatus]KAI8077729.1 RNA helicase [Halteromyces radiatus]
MSGSRRRTNQQVPPQDFDWELTSEPNVVNATLNLTTEQVLVSSVEKPKARTRGNKFDFRQKASQDHLWTLNNEASWNSVEPTWGTEAYGQSSTSKYSYRDNDINIDNYNVTSEPLITTSFKLNTDIAGDEPIFAPVTDFTLFRHKPVIPLADDVLYPSTYYNELEERQDGFLPNVPVNCVNGPYQSVDHYLATHFELMRQDSLIPLQKAVQGYRSTLSLDKHTDLFGDLPTSDPPVHHPQNYRIYERVQLNALVYGSRQILYRISFRLPYTVRISWPTSKRLIEGSIVLLSKDNFEKDLKIATVVQRGEEPMKGSSRFEYMIDICLERDNDEDPLGFGDPTSTDQDTYVMLEATEGYFEAYRHILNVMKEIPVDDLPFKPYLVDVDKDVRIPYYASIKRYYDLDTSTKNKRLGKLKPVDIMGTWPPYDIGMDKTQVDALQTILSNDLAIIQGPPGTGKTFVGTYAMKVLLSNLDNVAGPIVCICQTNHALDQFLEHIFNFEDRIVRVGGRSKSELLKDNLIYELRKTELNTRGAGRLYRKRDEIGKRIDTLIMELYEEPCVTLEFLTRHKLLRPRQLDSLKRMGEREDKRNKSSSKKNTLDNDDDDAWVVTPQPATAPLSNSRNGEKKFGKGKRQGNTTNSLDWMQGNPNHFPQEEEKPINPVEIWLRDAIEYINEQGVMFSYADELKDALLEQQKGLVFENDDEQDYIDEDEVQELAANYRDEDLRGNKNNRFINIGRAYKKESNDNVTSVKDLFFGNAMAGGMNNKTNDRKVINYKKTESAKLEREFTTDFSFFDDKEERMNDDDIDMTEKHQVLERWMKDDDVTLWPLTVRLKAHKKWANLRNQSMEKEIIALVRQYNQVSAEIRRINVLNDAQICRANRVVGMTSTAAAKYHDLLEEIKPSIMVVEEAAEMLESHIVTALVSSLQHLILIGDHQQLRPSTAVHALSEQHHLNVSLFERLVNNELPYTRLSHQRRMRPEIRTLIDPIYSNPPLHDHVDVSKYPSVRGMQRNVYFLAHEELEESMVDTASKTNLHEASMAAKLSWYLLMQGYNPQDITIITMYAGQRSIIKKQLQAERRVDCDTSAIHVSSVDGYQGEENKIIILSLVRSNMQGQIGFLKVANRVCVGLSRAKHGMYILGNAKLLCEKSDLWNEIVSKMEDGNDDVIGTQLGLKCDIHNVVTRVRWPVDFTEVKEGGCSRPCGTVLDCGHQCPLRCHAYEHDEVRCTEKCRKLFTECGHQCTRLCSQDCGSCITPIHRKLQCGHTIQGDCYKIRREIKANGGKCSDCSRL